MRLSKYRSGQARLVPLLRALLYLAIFTSTAYIVLSTDGSMKKYAEPLHLD